MTGFVLAMGLVVAQKALYRTSYDQLTLLPGREVFLLNLQREMNLQRRADVQPPLTVVFLDIDRFKLINQSFGHGAGDRVLQTLTKRLLQVLPEDSHLARVGGDEFAFLLTLNDQSELDQLLDRVQRELAEPITLAKQRLSITSSMGMVMARADHPLPPEDLLRDAHTAMYRAKTLSEDRYEVFATPMREEAVRRLELESHLLHAMERREFCCTISRLCVCKTAKLSGLRRWYGGFAPERGLCRRGSSFKLRRKPG